MATNQYPPIKIERKPFSIVGLFFEKRCVELNFCVLRQGANRAFIGNRKRNTGLMNELASKMLKLKAVALQANNHSWRFVFFKHGLIPV